MDGKGRATDNTWIERFWKSLKQNYVYLIAYYHQKKHQGIKKKPEEAFRESMNKNAA